MSRFELKGRRLLTITALATISAAALAFFGTGPITSVTAPYADEVIAFLDIENDDLYVTDNGGSLYIDIYREEIDSSNPQRTLSDYTLDIDNTYFEGTDNNWGTITIVNNFTAKSDTYAQIRLDLKDDLEDGSTPVVSVGGVSHETLDVINN